MGRGAEFFVSGAGGAYCLWLNTEHSFYHPLEARAVDRVWYEAGGVGVRNILWGLDKSDDWDRDSRLGGRGARPVFRFEQHHAGMALFRSAESVWISSRTASSL